MGRLTLLEALAGSGLVPDDWLRRLIRDRLARLTPCDPPLTSLADEAAAAPPEETPAAFFGIWLGPRMKYSCGLWPASGGTLAEAEDAMLALACERAGIADGMELLDLGAGWGSLAFYVAERWPKARVHALTRSRAQADFMRARAAARGLSSVTVEHADMRTVELALRYDRVLAIEAIEHVRNPAALLARIAGWLAPGGQLFVQAIAHGESAHGHEGLPWFAGGLGLSEDTLPSFDRDLSCSARWTVEAGHYRRTVEAWRARLGAARPAAIAALGGSAAAYRRWRAFLLACEELFGGGQWRVAHQAFELTTAGLAGRPGEALP